MTAPRPPALLVVGSGRREFREYVLAAAAREHRLVLLDEQPPTWQLPYLRGYAVAPFADPGAVRAAARRLRAGYGVAGVFTYDEALAVLAGGVAADLGLPHAAVDAIAACRDKLRMRGVLRAAGVPSAGYREVSTMEDAGAAAAELGYPVVVKPRALAASVGVVRAGAVAELAGAFRAAAQARTAGLPEHASVLVEEYLDGPEISVDAVLTGTATELAVVARKQLGFAPYFEETGHLVSDPEPVPGLPRVHEVVTAALAALGLRRGTAHVEVRLTAAGPRIVEVNPRLGGDLIPYLGQLATGVDLAAAAARIAAGGVPDLAKRWSRAAAIRFFHATRDTVIGSVGLAMRRRPGWLDRLTWLVGPGDAVRIDGGTAWRRLGFAVVTGADAAQCRERLDEVEAAVRIRSR
jgi:biotin carboxylase